MHCALRCTLVAALVRSLGAQTTGYESATVGAAVADMSSVSHRMPFPSAGALTGALRLDLYLGGGPGCVPAKCQFTQMDGVDAAGSMRQISLAPVAIGFDVGCDSSVTESVAIPFEPEFASASARTGFVELTVSVFCKHNTVTWNGLEVEASYAPEVDCASTSVPNSDFAATGALAGRGTVMVACDSSYIGGGEWVCDQTNGAFSGNDCTLCTGSTAWCACSEALTAELGTTIPGSQSGSFGDGTCDPVLDTAACNRDNGDCTAVVVDQCQQSLLLDVVFPCCGDHTCDQMPETCGETCAKALIPWASSCQWKFEPGAGSDLNVSGASVLHPPWVWQGLVGLCEEALEAGKTACDGSMLSVSSPTHPLAACAASARGNILLQFCSRFALASCLVAVHQPAEVRRNMRLSVVRRRDGLPAPWAHLRRSGTCGLHLQ